jgi:hypothetical protein
LILSVSSESCAIPASPWFVHDRFHQHGGYKFILLHSNQDDKPTPGAAREASPKIFFFNDSLTQAAAFLRG